MSDFGDLTHPVARRSHLCEWCERTIEKGQRHCQYRGKWQGEWQNWRMHEDCYTDYWDGDSYDTGFMRGDGRNSEEICKAHP